MQKKIQSLRRVAAKGLWTSVILVIATSLFLLAAPWQMRQNEAVTQWMLIAGSLLAVLTASMSLLVIRKQIPLLRQREHLADKVEGYAAHIRSLYLSTLGVTFMLCLLMILSGQTTLLMLTIVVVLVLFLAYPNRYKMKNDLGLSDDDMRELFGDDTIH